MPVVLGKIDLKYNFVCVRKTNERRLTLWIILADERLNKQNTA